MSLLTAIEAYFGSPVEGKFDAIVFYELCHNVFSHMRICNSRRGV